MYIDDVILSNKKEGMKYRFPSSDQKFFNYLQLQN
jgi:hypothetical protein